LPDGLAEQAVGHVDGIHDLKHDDLSKVVTGFVNTLARRIGRLREGLTLYSTALNSAGS
jgi:hypothetical protein